MREYLANIVGKALRSLSYDNKVPLTFETPKVKAHGDLTTNVAMSLAKVVRKPSREIAKEILDRMEVSNDVLSDVQVAGPGFLNFKFTDRFFTRQLGTVLKDPTSYGRSIVGKGKKTQVEFVSANPTGPLSVGHGRQAAIGDTLANLLDWTGHAVTREYYFNNAGRQMRLLAESTFARYLQLFDPRAPFPDDGYQGEYIGEMAKLLAGKRGKELLSVPTEQALGVCKEFAEELMFQGIKNVLARMGVVHDVYFNEDSLYSSGKVREVVEAFRNAGLAYDKDGAVWLRTSALGLEQDRVIVKSTGEPTYRLPDIAYHREKFLRGFELIVDVFGADHVATIPDVLAGVRALGFNPDCVKVVIHQFVTLLRDGEQVKMSKRLANFVTLDELIEEVGADATRFFFLMRSTTSHLEFDINLAKDQSEKNPVYYLQYAHARIASIVRFGEGQNLVSPAGGHPDISYELLKEAAEVELTKMLLAFPDVVQSSSAALEPHRLCTYLHDVASAFHHFYHELRVVIPERPLAEARMELCRATKAVLANGLRILGISAPERM